MTLIDRDMAIQSPQARIAAELGITPRMFDVLELALEAHSAKKIAGILGINDTNVRRYLSRLYERFGVSSRSGLQARLGPATEVLRSIANSRGKDAAQ